MILTINGTDDLSKYYRYKIIEHLLLSRSLEEGLEYLSEIEISNIFQIEILNEINDCLKEDKFQKLMTKSVKDRMLDLLSCFREMAVKLEEMTKSVWIEKTNEAICRLNEQKTITEEELIKNEMQKRYDTMSTKIRSVCFREELEFDLLKDSICLDIDLLTFLIDNTSEEEFEEELGDFLISHATLSSLCTFYKECPGLFQKKEFRARVMAIFQNNHNLIANKPCNYLLDEEDNLVLKDHFFRIRNREVQYKLRKIKKIEGEQ